MLDIASFHNVIVDEFCRPPTGTVDSDPVDWLVFVGCNTGVTLTVHYMPDHPTILTALAMFQESESMLGYLKHEEGAIVTYKVSVLAVQPPTHEAPGRMQ